MKIVQYQQFIHQSRYARWREDLGRRETWPETVDRYCQALGVPPATRNAILNMDVMPSMRSLWSAGANLSGNHIAGYNCAFAAVDSARIFDEAIYILMSGCGLGFSVERQFINQLPTVPSLLNVSNYVHIVEDSKKGWARAYRELIQALYSGFVQKWDLTNLRPAGSRLVTSGGRSSGPAPLRELFKFTIQMFKNARGRKLNSVECHDIMCKVGEVVVAGGVRRSALISLSNLSDDRMRKAKHGAWWQDEPQRALANNSAAYTEKPDFEVFMDEWRSLYASKCGERGIYNRQAAKLKAESIGRNPELLVGTNPCAEISLRSNQFCNLTEVIIRPEDTFDDLKRKVEHATILGTLQSTLVDFKYLRPVWRKNCEEERLLGVSLTGIMDHAPIPRDELKKLRDHARHTNIKWAKELGINPSAAITTVKPSGTVSQLCDSSSGIHPRFSSHYVRRVRQSNHDPLTQLLIDQGVPHEVDQMQPSNTIFEFPQKAPEGAVLVKDMSAIDQCEAWLAYNEAWAEHSVSCTVYYSKEEFLTLGQWVWSNFDKVTGLSFLPRSEHTYAQAPYEAISGGEYLTREIEMPNIDWSKLSEYEKEDNTVGAQTLACVGDKCELS